MKDRLIILFAILGLLTLRQNAFAQQNAEKHVLRKEAPSAALARPVGKPAPTDSLRIAISLPLRNREALDELLKRLYDPGSPDYRQYLTPGQFTANFGPTEEDYQSVINFAQSFGLSIEKTHDNRLLLDVRGKVADLERAFHVTLRTYQHPSEARQFRAPEAEPWVDPKLPIQEVIGLSDYVLLRPTAHRKPVKTQSGAAGGSSPIAGDFIGQDFRNAYAPGVSLTGAGQRVGLFEADGYYSADIDNYEAYAGQSPVALQNVLVDGFNGVPGALNPEVAADIEMAIAMAPGLSAVVVFECTNSVSGTNSGGTEVQYWLDTLDRMASSNQIKQFSSSWGYVTADPTQDPNTAFDAAFKQMATQGQTFFQASGDGDAWATPIWVPADSPYVTSVGGTMLNMNGLGASFASETVWNSGLGPPGWPITGNNYWGSGGGVSTVYPIPYWQTNVSMTANLGSTTNRNIPDVALTATNIFITADNGEFGGYFGTSCSAPLWAGYNALINQQAANSSKPPVGFINPAIYALGQGPNYSLCFHDTTIGSNTYAGSPSKYFATTGFDLCTGWGTPTGSNLINALAGVYQPTITTQPNSQTVGVGGSVTFTVAATGVAPFSYQWQFGGTSIASATQTSFSLSNLVGTNGGNYTVVVTNQWGSVTSSVAALTVNSGTPVVTWANPAAITYGTALSSVQLNATANVAGTFVYTPASGTVLNAGNNTLTAIFTPTDTVDYSKATNTVSLAVSPATLTITANNKTKTYGQTVTFAGTEFSTGGLVNGNTVTSVTLASSGAAATAGASGVLYSIVPSAAIGTGLANYNISYVNGSLTVNKAALSVTASAQSKTYGQTVNFGSGSTLFTSIGLQNGEAIGSVTLAVNNGGGAATASVSGSYTITPSAATGGTFSSGNYTITYHTAALTISRAALSITASAQSKSYGQTVTFGSGSSLFTSGGLQNGETVGSVTLAVNNGGGAATASVSGSYTITPSAATGGTFTANNYTVSYNTGSLTVNRASLGIMASAESKTYGQIVTFGSGSTLFTSSGLQNGETIGTVTLGVSGNGGLATASVSGSYTITPSAATGGTFAANNYSITYNSGNLTVNPAAVTVTANAQSKSYGQTVATGSGSAQFTSSPLQNGETIGSVSLSVNNNGSAAIAPVSGSPYAITPSAATGGTFSAGNYTITYAPGNLTVNPVGLTITASAETKSYGQTLAFGAGSGLFTSSGLQNGETIGSVTLAVSGNGGAATALVSGSPYLITPSAATGGTFTPGNYSINYSSGALTVNPATLTITASAQSKTYGQIVSFGSGSTLFTSSALQNEETIGSVTLSVNNNGGAANAPVSGSPYAITPSAAGGGTFSPGNYSITYAGGNLTVSAAALMITANSRSKTYGQTVTFAGTEFTTSGLLNGDTVASATLSSSGTATTAAVAGSPYSIIPSAATGTGLGNYTISYNSGTLSINKAGLTVTANSRSKTYGQTVSFAGTEFVTSGLLNGDTVSSASISSSGAAATAVVSGSPYAIVPSAATGTGLGNYTINYGNGTLTINPATLSITANNRSKTYGQTVTFAGTEFTASGLLNGDSVGGVTLSSSGTAATATVSGSAYAIVPNAATGTGLNNYTIGYSSGALTVNPASLTITANNRSKTYGQTVSFAGTEFTSAGLLNSDTVSSVTLTSLGVSSSATVSGSPYAIVPSAAVGTGLGNYNIGYVNGTLTVIGSGVTVTWNDPAAITYGAAISSSQLNATASVPGTFVYTPTNNSIPNSGLNSLTVVFTPTDTVDYSSVTDSVSLVVQLAPLTVTAASYSRPFNTANPVFTGIINGLVNSDNISANYACAATPSTPLGSYAVTPILVDPNNRQTNYSVTLVNGALSIVQAAPVVTWANPQTIIYGSALGGSQLNAMANIPGTFKYTPASGSVLNSGSNGLSVVFTANDPVDYASATNSVGLMVGLANLTVTADSFNRAFDTANPVFTGTVAGVVNGDNITATYNSTATIASPVGTYPITPTLVDPGNRETNYNVSLVNGILVIGHPTETFSWATPTPIVYGTPLGANQLNASVNVIGTYAYSPTNGTVLNTGTNTLTVVFTPSDTVDDTGFTNSVSLVVMPAPLTITGAVTNRQYGQSNPALMGTISGIANGDIITDTFSCGATVTSPVGSYAIVPGTAVGADLTNYAITYVNGSLTVNSAALTVTANNRAKTYGQVASFAGTEFIVSGLLNSDSVTKVTLASPGAAASAPVSSSPYAILPSAAIGNGLANYTIAYAGGNLTVSPAALTIMASSRSKTYGQTVTFAGTEFTTSGLLNGDTVASATLGSSGMSATAGVAGSPYAIVPSAATGTGLGNYTISYSSGTLTINKAGLTLAANSRSKTYGQTVTFAGTEFATSGLLNGDTVTSASISSSGAAATAAVSGSPYAIVPVAATGTGLGNYSISYGSGTLTINPATLSITANNRSKTYGQTVTFLGTEFTTIGLLNSDSIGGVTLSSSGAAATAVVSGSPYAIVPSAATGTGLGNYTISYNNGTLTINPATLSITANSRSKTYGQTVTFAGTEFTTTGLLNSDSVGAVTLSSSGTAATAIASGTPYAIVPSAATGTGLNNYTIGYSSGALTVNPASLTITANNRSKTYGQTVSFAGTEFTSAGLLNSDTVSSVTLTSLGVSSSATVAGSPYAIVPSAAVGTGLGNYNIGYVNGTLTVIGSGVTVTWNNPAAITYGAAISSSQLNATASVPGTFVYTPTNNSVPNSGLNSLTVVFTPTDTVDYSSVTDTVSLVVQLAPLTVTAASYSRPFNTANPVFTGTINGLVNSDNISANYSCAATVSSPVGTYPIVPSLVDPNNRRTNYTVSLVNGILVVGHPSQVNSWTNPAPIIYGTPLSSMQLNESVNVVGSYAYTPPAGAVLNTGTNTLSVVFTPSDPVDYISVTDSVSLVVLPAPLTIAAANATRQYGQANPIFVGTMSGLTNGDIITDTYSSSATTASPVGTYTISPGSAAGSDLTNYSITYANGTLTITPANLTVTANSRTKSYGQSASFVGTEFITSGLMNGDTVSHVNLTSSGASPTATVAGSPYAIVPGAATGSGLGNYSITYANGTLTVSPAGLTITANNQTKTFGQTVNFVGTEFTASGLFNGDSVISVSLASAGSSTTASVAGSPYVISPSAANGSGLGNYTIAYVGGRLRVLEASPVVTWPNPNPIVYGTDLDTNELNATASVPGNFSYTPTNGTVLNSGTNTLSVLFTPSDSVDYTTATAIVSLTVLPAPLTVTADSFSRSFETDNPVFTGTISGLTNGDVISASYSCAAGFSSPVGTYSIVPNLIDPSDRAANYSVNLIDGILVVGHPVEVFNWPNPAPIVYGTPLSIVQLNASVNVLGTYAYSPTNGTVLNTGTNILSVIFTPSDTFDYTSVTDTVSVVVTPAPLSIGGPIESRQYGQANPDLTGTITGLTNGDDINVSFTSSANTASKVGTYAIVPGLATGSDLTNYIISYANGSLTVTPAALNITANNRTKVYGQSLTVLGTEFTTTGLVNGDSVSRISLSSPGTAANSLVAGSPYVITPSAAIGNGLANYSISYANGSLLISPAALTITADNENKIVGQTFLFSGTEFTAKGLVNSDSVTSVTLTSLGASASAAVAGSPYAIVPSAAEGVGLANYAISYVNGTLTVSSGSQPVIQSATRSGNTIIFNWSTAASQSYQIQYTTNLDGDPWTDLGGPVTATNSSAAAAVTITNSRTFYRLLLLP
ncbi:MAG TPA: MBG domain-containing protein [Verrucomicrobiae bacterium]